VTDQQCIRNSQGTEEQEYYYSKFQQHEGGNVICTDISERGRRKCCRGKFRRTLAASDLTEDILLQVIIVIYFNFYYTAKM
jgi:hypothetical protein